MNIIRSIFNMPLRSLGLAALLSIMFNAHAADSLPSWLGSEFASLRFSRTNCQIVFKEQGGRFSCTIQRPDQPDETVLSSYGSTLEFAFGSQAKLQARGFVIEIGSLPVVKREDAVTPPKSLCDFTGTDRRKLCLDVPAYVFFKRVDQRSMGASLKEQRAVLVPISGLAEPEIARLENLLKTKFNATPSKNDSLLWVACERTAE